MECIIRPGTTHCLHEYIYIYIPETIITPGGWFQDLAFESNAFKAEKSGERVKEGMIAEHGCLMTIKILECSLIFKVESFKG